MINAGELNKKIVLQTESGAADTYGQTGGTWADTVTVYAQIITTGGREFYAAQKTNAETAAVFKIRYRAVTTQQRIKYGNRIFQILSIADPEEKHSELLISAKEVV
jgi:SPP1 family predicted phage head-tail adaptor